MKQRLNNIYRSMKQRCFYSKSINYNRYGGKGIKICKEWADTEKVPNTTNCSKGWLAFKKWALENGYADNLTIDRIDSTKGYSPENCRWVDYKTQENNTGHNHNVTYKGRTQSLVLWCEELGLNYDRTKQRINKLHWGIEKAFETKNNDYIKQFTYNGKTQSLSEWSAELKMPYNTLYSRIVLKDWTIEKAFSQKIKGARV